MKCFHYKRKRLHKSSPPTGLVLDKNMAAVSLIWNANMAAMTSCENTQFQAICKAADHVTENDLWGNREKTNRRRRKS